MSENENNEKVIKFIQDGHSLYQNIFYGGIELRLNKLALKVMENYFFLKNS